MCDRARVPEVIDVALGGRIVASPSVSKPKKPVKKIGGAGVKNLPWPELVGSVIGILVLILIILFNLFV